LFKSIDEVEKCVNFQIFKRQNKFLIISWSLKNVCMYMCMLKYIFKQINEQSFILFPFYFQMSNFIMLYFEF
jgi:hypothetical protein